MFRGRETTHPERGEQLLMRLAEDCRGLGTIEQRPSLDGPQHDDGHEPAEGEGAQA
jgi:translation initiation factor IF-3